VIFVTNGVQILLQPHDDGTDQKNNRRHNKELSHVTRGHGRGQADRGERGEAAGLAALKRMSSGLPASCRTVGF
jgi:hypothetical protein